MYFVRVCSYVYPKWKLLHRHKQIKNHPPSYKINCINYYEYYDEFGYLIKWSLTLLDDDDPSNIESSDIQFKYIDTNDAVFYLDGVFYSAQSQNIYNYFKQEVIVNNKIFYPHNQLVEICLMSTFKKNYKYTSVVCDVKHI